MRLFTIASYLDGFYADITPNERKSLLEQLASDIKAYPDSQLIIFVDPRYTKLIANFYYAYAYDVLAAHSPAGIYKESDVRANYENARASVDTKNGYFHTYGVYGSYIDTYYLAHLAGTNVKDAATKATVESLVTEMREYMKLAPTVPGSVSNLYKYFNGRGSWSANGPRLLDLSKKNALFGAFYSEMNATSTSK